MLTPQWNVSVCPRLLRPAKRPAEAGGLWAFFIVENMSNLFISWSALEIVWENMCNGLKVLVGTKDQPVYLTELTTSYWLRNAVVWLHLENRLKEVMWKNYFCPVDSPVSSINASRGRHWRVPSATDRNFLGFMLFVRKFCKIVCERPLRWNLDPPLASVFWMWMKNYHRHKCQLCHTDEIIRINTGCTLF